MWRWAEKSIRRLAWLSAAGGVISSLTFVFMRAVSLPYEKLHHGAFAATVALLFGLLIGGFFFSASAESRIRNGIAAERWPEAAVESLRNIMKSPWWIAVMVAMFLLYLAGLFAPPNSVFHACAWVGFIAIMNVSRLSSSMQRPKSPSEPASAKWRDSLPIRSQRWGQR